MNLFFLYVRRSRLLSKLLMVFAIVPLLAGCGTMWQSLPERSATEQLLISTAADRAIVQLPEQAVRDRRVFLVTANLECYDKPYIIERFRQEIVAKKGVLATDIEQADVILEVASGGLSIDQYVHLLGMPAIPLASETLKTPEIPLYKREVYKGKAKFILIATDAATGLEAAPVPVLYGRSQMTGWWLLILGPLRVSDIPEELQE